MTRYTITAPDNDNDGRPRPESWDGREMPRYADYARRLILGAFAGATAAPSIGYWRAPDGMEYMSETVTVWTIDAPDTDWPRIQAIARELAAYARQEAVYVTRSPVETELVKALTLAA